MNSVNRYEDTKQKKYSLELDYPPISQKTLDVNSPRYNTSNYLLSSTFGKGTIFNSSKVIQLNQNKFLTKENLELDIKIAALKKNYQS